MKLKELFEKGKFVVSRQNSILARLFLPMLNPLKGKYRIYMRSVSDMVSNWKDMRRSSYVRS